MMLPQVLLPLLACSRPQSGPMAVGPPNNITLAASQPRSDQDTSSALAALRDDYNTVSLFLKKEELSGLAATPIPFGIKDVETGLLESTIDGSWAEQDSESFHSKAERCAVVGNAGSMLGSGSGAEIDTADVVWRFNDAPTQGYEADVGTKTSFRIAGNNQIGKARSKGINLGKLLYYFHRGDGGKEGNRNVRYFQEKLQGQAIWFSPAFLQYVWKTWIGREVAMWGSIVGVTPSSGMMALVMALRTCKQVHLYGFDLTSKKAHYYDDSSADYKAVPHHDFVNEEAARRSLAAVNAITVHTPAASGHNMELANLASDPTLCTGWPCVEED